MTPRTLQRAKEIEKELESLHDKKEAWRDALNTKYDWSMLLHAEGKQMINVPEGTYNFESIAEKATALLNKQIDDLEKEFDGL